LFDFRKDHPLHGIVGVERLGPRALRINRQCLLEKRTPGNAL